MIVHNRTDMISRGNGGYLTVGILSILVGVTLTSLYSVNYITYLERHFKEQIRELKEEVQDSLVDVDILLDKLSDAESKCYCALQTDERSNCDFEN